MRFSVIGLAILLFAAACQNSAAFKAVQPCDEPAARALVLNDGPYNQIFDGLIGVPDNAENWKADSEMIYFLILRETGETYMALDEISVISGGAPDYRSGDNWYFQLIDEQQHVLEQGYFQRSGMICSDSMDSNGQWTGSCYESDTPLTLEIPYCSNGADITVYDENGLVRFGPYDVRGM
jgi:hypothetical protein